MTTRQAVIRALRTTRALPAAERIRFLRSALQSRGANRAFVDKHPGQPMPPRWLAYDAFGHIDFATYWTSGQVVADYVAQLARRHLDSTPATVCDWGCGPARVVRHLATKHGDVFDRVIGTDYNARSVEWGRRHIDGVEFLHNGLAPPLPLQDGEVDLIFARSVFTHLSEEMVHSWAAELTRVTRGGGLIVFTTHGDGFADKLLANERERYQNVGFVERSQVKEGARAFVTFTHPTWVRSSMVPNLDLVEHIVDAPVEISTGQDIWVFRRP